MLSIDQQEVLAKRVIDKYGKKRYLEYDLQPGSEDRNAVAYRQMKKALDAVGVSLTVKNNKLEIYISPERYGRITSRGAGSKSKYIFIESNGEKCIARYSDIVFMLQSMTDQEICKALQIKPATYYRHKKKMKESSYYQSLNAAKVRGKDYLKSLPEDKAF